MTTSVPPTRKHLYDKAPAPTCRLVWNHPLPDGNKRAAWACLLLFVDLNGGSWDPDPLNVEDAVHAIFDVAARKIDEESFAGWLRRRLGWRWRSDPRSLRL